MYLYAYIQKGRKGKKKGSVEVNSPWELDLEKENILSILFNTLDADLTLLWDHHQPEEAFVGVLSKIAFLVLENPVNSKSKAIKSSAFMIIGTLAMKYHYSIHIVSSMMDHMRKVENIVTVFVDLVDYVVTSHNFSPIITDILRDISKITANELEKNATLAKNISSFVAELSERLPKLILPSISLLLTHLENENATMRSGVIQSLGYLVCKAYNAQGNEDSNNSVKTRDSLLEILVERIMDKTSYTRVRVLQTWSYLCQERSIPLNMYVPLTNKCAHRVEDKSSFVRRAAIQLLTNLLLYNPYSSQLKMSTFKTSLQKINEQIDRQDDTMELDFGNLSQDTNHNYSQEILSQLDKNEDLSTANQTKIKLYCKSSIAFIESIHKAINTICNLLGSKMATDVLESANFLSCAHQFGIESAGIGIQKMLMLIWTKETQIKECIKQCYINLYMTPPSNLDKKKSLLYIAKNLIGLVKGNTVGEMASLEELLTELYKEGRIPPKVVDVLWDVLAKSKKDMAQERYLALAVISMVANADPKIIRSNLNTLTNVGLGPQLNEDLVLAKYCCIALQKLVPKSSKDEKTATSIPKFTPTHIIFSRLAELIKLGVHMDSQSPQLNHWFTSADQAVNTIFAISKNPDSILGDCIKYMANEIFTSKNLDSSDPSRLAALFHVVGHVALKQLVYVEEIGKHLQRERMGLSKGRNQQDDEELEAIEKELGGLGVPGETMEDEQKRLKVEWDIAENNLLGSFLPLIATVCVNTNKSYSNQLLRQSAFTALCKFMLVSPSTCEKFMQLLCTVLSNKQTTPSLKSNIVIALGDLSFRHPNIVEPWSDYLYSCLSDHDDSVRKNTLMVLTHLILNDMIKVKGQISEMSICLEDSNSRISDLAKLFFHELSGKGNTIFNVLPDTISGLSQNPNISFEQFKSILKYLFSFIEKDRQLESLIDKLCKRFPLTADPKQWKYIAYCISVINHTEKTLKKLMDSAKLCKEALQDQCVQEYFQKTIEKCQKSTKAELKSLADELHNAIFNSDDGTSVVPTTNTIKAEKPSRRRTKRKEIESDDEIDMELEEESDEQMEVEEEEVRPKRSTRRK